MRIDMTFSGNETVYHLNEYITAEEICLMNCTGLPGDDWHYLTCDVIDPEITNPRQILSMLQNKLTHVYYLKVKKGHFRKIKFTTLTKNFSPISLSGVYIVLDIKGVKTAIPKNGFYD